MTEALTILDDKLLSLLKGEDILRNNLDTWFRHLSDPNNVDGNRFVFCLAIDLKFELLDTSSLLKLFRELDYSNLSSVIRQFDLKLHRESEKYFFHSNYSDAEYGKEKYVCIKTWTKLYDKIKQYVPAAGKDTIFDLTDETLVMHRLFTEFSLDLQDVKEWSGWKWLTWLLPHHQFIKLGSMHSNEDDRLNYLMDSLGLEPPVRNTATGEYDFYVYIEFPDDFDIASYQPSSLCGYWIEPGGLYLSFKKQDGYGRTFSTTSGSNNANERVINSKDYGNEKFIPYILGKADGTLKVNRKNILDEALKRLLDVA